GSMASGRFGLSLRLAVVVNFLRAVARRSLLDVWPLDAHDGFPGPLRVPIGRFRELQSSCEHEGLPLDSLRSWAQVHVACSRPSRAAAGVRALRGSSHREPGGGGLL